MSITINQDLQVDAVRGLHNSAFQFRGCDGCMAEAMASYMRDNDTFRAMIFRTMILFSMQAAKKL